MTDDELTAALTKRKAVVVHFSHLSNMRDGGVFPDDLQAAIRNKDTWPLSCSVLWPGHTMQPCGSVGVLFNPSVAAVLSVLNSDSGSYSGPDGIDYSAGQPLNSDTFESTFRVVDAYNEWRVRGAKVMGIFVYNIRVIQAKKSVKVGGLPDGEFLETIGLTRVELTEVFDAFGTLPVFTMTPSGLIRVARP